MRERFIADTMLGKLARWLRILGCDVEYFERIDDGDLADRVEATGRILLTRDTLIVRRRKVRDACLLVRGDSWKEQLRQVAAHFGIAPRGNLFTRCVLCNEPLREADKASVEGRVPPYVYATQERFASCPACGRIYWKATHHAGMEARLREILGE